MTEYSKFNIVYHLQKWMDSVPGQTFLNYAYSWGASIVILGTLFKLTHLPGANLMLFIGMGTEVLVFFLSAFDRPFDKTSIGKELPTHIFGENASSDEAMADGSEISSMDGELHTAAATSGSNIIGGGTIIIGGRNDAHVASEGLSYGATTQHDESSDGISSEQLAASVGSNDWIKHQQQVSPEMADATNNYVEELNKLTEMLAKVSEQSMRLTRDSEEMENLNRTLTGICKVYEMQLKGASQQIGTIDQINEQSRKMAQQIEQLNKIYARMIEAMTVNMRTAAPGNVPTVGEDL